MQYVVCSKDEHSMTDAEHTVSDGAHGTHCADAQSMHVEDQQPVAHGSTAGPPWTKPHVPSPPVSVLTVLRVVSAAAVAANVLYLFSDVTVDGERYIVVVVAVPLVRILALAFLAGQGHYFDQAERLLLRLLHRHRRVFHIPRGEPSAVHEGGCRIHARVIRRLEHFGEDAENKAVRRRAVCVWVGFKGPSIKSAYLPCFPSQHPRPLTHNRPLSPTARFPHLYLISAYADDGIRTAAASLPTQTLQPDPLITIPRMSRVNGSDYLSLTELWTAVGCG